jgi:hypothetical protein
MNILGYMSPTYIRKQSGQKPGSSKKEKSCEKTQRQE